MARPESLAIDLFHDEVDVGLLIIAGGSQPIGELLFQRGRPASLGGNDTRRRNLCLSRAADCSREGGRKEQSSGKSHRKHQL